jgi:hypothetical protein
MLFALLQAQGVVNAWSGGVYDPVLDQLLIWGGGHTDYAGNEVYAFDMGSLTWQRLTDPYTLIDAVGAVESSGEYPDAQGNPLPQQPRSRHTYNYCNTPSG